jgi:hypothetical protein
MLYHTLCKQCKSTPTVDTQTVYQPDDNKGRVKNFVSYRSKESARYIAFTDWIYIYIYIYIYMLRLHTGIN